MKKIDIDKIRGHYQVDDGNGNIGGGDDTVESIKMVAEKVNEIVEVVNKLKSFTGENLTT